MTDEQKEQIAAEIDNEGFEYWLVNFSSNSLAENNAPQHIVDMAKNAARVMEEIEETFIKEGLFIG